MDGAVAVGPLARIPEHRVELVLDVLVADQATSVDVEVARGDRRLVPPDPRELPDGVFGDEGHSTSMSDGWDPLIVGLWMARRSRVRGALRGDP